MGNRLSIETFAAKSQRENREFRISIDAVQCRIYGPVTLYEGKRFYETFYSDDLGVAKFHSKLNSREWAKTRVCITFEAFEVAEKFNKVLADYGERSGHNVGAVHFTDVILAKVDETPIIFAKKIKRGQFYTFESKINNFTRLIDADGKSILQRSRSFRRSFSQKKRSISVSSTASLREQESEFIEQADVEGGHSYIHPPPYTNCGPPNYEESEAEAKLMQRTRTDSDVTWEIISYAEVSSCPIPATRSQSLWASAPALGQPTTTDFCSPIRRGDTDSGHLTRAQVLEAFVHYFYSQTGGKSIVSNLKGSLDKEGQFTLTTPVIHSLSRAYGERDRGEQGIATVIQNHRCNRLCQNFGDMSLLLKEAKRDFLTRNCNNRDAI